MKWLVAQTSLDNRFTDAMPTALLHPISGSGSRAMMIDTMKTFGPDSFVGRLACVFQGSAETILYVVALYFGSVQVKNIRYTLWAGLFADLVGIITAVGVSYLFFG
jgi:spore maturation protein SpmB